ncbi:MAG: hypothetical protein V1698_03305 [bacterium]
MKKPIKIILIITTAIAIIGIGSFIYIKYFFELDFCHCVEVAQVPYAKYDMLPLITPLEEGYKKYFNINNQPKYLIIPEDINLKDYFYCKYDTDIISCPYSFFDYFRLKDNTTIKCGCFK